VKLYVVVRADLEPGAQIAQSCHALRLFGAEHARLDEHWYRTSNNLVCLTVASETDLLQLAERAMARGVSVSVFHEPDLGDQATALALEPEARSLVGHLPLALRLPQAA
jgi:peptidyl-tRNA hydrolase